MHTVIEVINEVCFSYKLTLNVQNTRQNMAVSNPLPPPEAVYNVVSVSALKNSRRKMEDRHIVIHDLNTIFTKQDTTPSHYYAVFDGHDGEDAAAYCVNYLHQYLAESTNFTTDPEQALRDAFCRTDSMFLNKCESENIVGGTTAVCALLLPKEKSLYIAWTGDSQAALVSQGKIVQLVKPHKPDREDERMRIEKEGGIVIHWGVWRVNGQLGVSRAIGDSQYKPYVTAVPEIVKISLGPEDDFFVLGSDGLWDHVSETDIAKVVYDVAYSNPDKAELVSRDLVQLAKCNGSSDNISVVVVFLRHPRNIAAGPRWTNTVVGMDALDNANNPFVVANKANGEGLNEQEGLLLNINDGFEALKKKDDMPNNDLIKMLEKSNSARLTPEFDKDDNLGPETDVDNVDDGSLSPNLDVMTLRLESINNNQHFNPFNDIEKSLELNLNLKEGTFEQLTTPVEETCPAPTNSVHNVSQLIDAGAESDSEEEEEWNYVSGQEANKENVLPLQLNSKVAEEEEEEDDTEETMSQLNPNAAEFVPVSPTRSAASPLGRLLCDEVLSQSPKRPPSQEELDLNVPTPVDFEKDISQKPHEIEETISNGHQQNDADVEAKENAINVSVNNKSEEFHFGPNAAPFTPVKLHDQSEASSTRAVYGDESVLTLGTSFNDSQFSQDDLDRAELTAKGDPMSMSFHQDRDDDTNPFDLNKVHVLPDDDDDEERDEESVGRCDLSNSLLNETISDLAEHFPQGKPVEEEPRLQIPVTDLDHEDNKNLYENRVTSPLKSDRTESPLEDSRTESPSEHDRLSIPFEEDRAVSPIQEQKISSHFEDRELFSPEAERGLVSPLGEQKSIVLMGDKEEIHHGEEEMCTVIKDKEIVEEKEVHSLVQDKEVSSVFGGSGTRHLSEDNEEKCVIEEKEVCSLLDADKEKRIIEEKEASSPLEEEKKECNIEERGVISPFEEKKEDLMVEEKEVSSPLDDDAELSSVDERAVISPVEEKDVACPLEARPVKSPVEEKHVASLLEEKDVASALEEKDVSPLEEKDVASPLEEKDIASLLEESSAISPFQEVVTSLVQEKEIGFPIEQTSEIFSVEQKSEIFSVVEKSDIFPMEQKSDILSVDQTTEIFPVEQKSEIFTADQKSEILPVEELTMSLQSEEKGPSCQLENQVFGLSKEEGSGQPSEEREVDRTAEEPRIEVKVAESLLGRNDEFSSVTENRTRSPEEDQIISAVQIKEDLVSSLVKPCFVPFEASSFDNLERPRSVASDATPDVEEVAERRLENAEVKSTLEKKVDYAPTLDVLNMVTSSEERGDAADNELPRTPNTSNLPTETALQCDVAPAKTPEPEPVVVSSLETQSVTSESVTKTEERDAFARPPDELMLSPVPSDLDDPLHSHPTPEYDQLLADRRGLLDASATGSFVDTESVATTEVNSFLGRSLLQDVESPLSPNTSVLDRSVEPTHGPDDKSSASIINQSADVSPTREAPKEFTDLTSTPAAGRPQSLSPLLSQVMADKPAAEKVSKLAPKEPEKKAAKAKTTPSTAAKKAPTPRSSLGTAAKATGPSPRAAAPAKPSRPTPSKTDTGAATKAPTKPAAVPKTTAARVPLSSRTTTKPAAAKTGETNGDTKTTHKTSTGAVKKNMEGSGSTRTTSSTVGSKTASGTASSRSLLSARNAPTSATATSNRSAPTSATATSNRGATTTAAPKARPNTLKPAPSKTATATKSTTAAKPSTTTTQKAPTSTRPAASSLSNRAPISRSAQPRPAHSTTEKQIKETANKLTASRTTTLTKTSSTTRKSDEKFSATKTTSSRTTSATSTTTSAASTYRPPIRRPAASTDAKTAATKVGKPKQNGVAAVVTEQIIVSKTQQQGAEMNGLSNGDGRFVKDNSPVDNKLIVESSLTTEAAAN